MVAHGWKEQHRLAGASSGTDKRCLLFCTVLLLFSFYNIRPWQRSGLLDNAYFLSLCQSEVAQVAVDGEAGEFWHAVRSI